MLRQPPTTISLELSDVRDYVRQREAEQFACQQSLDHVPAQDITPRRAAQSATIRRSRQVQPDHQELHSRNRTIGQIKVIEDPQLERSTGGGDMAGVNIFSDDEDEEDDYEEDEDEEYYDEDTDEYYNILQYSPRRDGHLETPNSTDGSPAAHLRHSLSVESSTHQGEAEITPLAPTRSGSARRSSASERVIPRLRLPSTSSLSGRPAYDYSFDDSERSPAVYDDDDEFMSDLSTYMRHRTSLHDDLEGTSFGNSRDSGSQLTDAGSVEIPTLVSTSEAFDVCPEQVSLDFPNYTLHGSPITASVAGAAYRRAWRLAPIRTTIRQVAPDMAIPFRPARSRSSYNVTGGSRRISVASLNEVARSPVVAVSPTPSDVSSSGNEPFHLEAYRSASATVNVAEGDRRDTRVWEWDLHYGQEELGEREMIARVEARQE